MVVDGGPQEILGTASDRERPGRSRRVLRGAVLLVVVVVGVVGWVSVHRRHEQALVRIAACAGAGQDAVAAANARVSGMADYVRVTLSSGPPDQLREGLLEMVARTASRSLEPVERARAGCEFGLPPYLRSARRAHASYLAYLDEEYRVLASTASNGAEVYTQRPLLNQLRQQAGTDLREAGTTLP